jgi:hypothetical protein
MSASSNRVSLAWTAPNQSGITSYKLYAKNGYFPNNNVPSQDYLIANTPKDTTYYDYIAPQNGTYYFRIYSVNDDINQLSTGYASGNVAITVLPAVRDISINALRFQNDIELDDIGGSRTTGYVTDLSPSFTWRVGMDSDSTSIPSGLNYRISVRQPTSGNLPSSSIYYQITGMPLQRNENPVFTYDFNTNTNSNNGAGPYRNYDVVVEALDTSGNTSAGNNINNTTEYGWMVYPNGYDIMYVSNPPITGIYLTNNNVVNGDFITEQFIDIDGSVKVKFSSGQLPNDIAGYYIYSSPNLFSGENITGGVQPVVNINTGNYPYADDYFFNDPKAGLRKYTSGYLALSLYDSFDAAQTYNGFDIKTGLWVTNVVPILNSGDHGIVEINNKLHVNNPLNLAQKFTWQVKNNTSNLSEHTITDHYGVEWRVSSTNNL